MTIISFGQITELIGKELVVKDMTDTDTLRSYLEAYYPSLQQVKYRMAVDKQVIHQRVHLTETSVVALLPPFSGG